MTPDPYLIDEKLSVADAMDRMLANNIRHLVVVSNGQAVGVVDSADLSMAADLSPLTTREIPVAKAKRRLFQAPKAMPLADAVKVMEGYHYTCTVVVDEGHVVGIFTLTDALRALRQIARGHPVEPQVVPTHRPPLSDERDKTAPRVRAKRVLADRGAAPTAQDGLVFGTVGL